MKLDPYFSPDTKTTSKWFKNLNVTPATINLPEEKIGGKLHDNGLGKDFMDMTPKAQKQTHAYMIN